MTSKDFAAIEEYLQYFRTCRRLLLALLFDQLMGSNLIVDPILALSRLFVRLKSADSIVEKLNRKNIHLDSLSQLADKMPDILGCRIVLATLDELHAVNQFVSAAFEIVSSKVHITESDEFGGRGIEHQVLYHVNGDVYPIALQLRTFLQHYWAASTFHLFHKRPREIALAHQSALRILGDALYTAELSLRSFPVGNAVSGTKSHSVWLENPMISNVHLISVELGERILRHTSIALTGDGQVDHNTIAANKMRLYSEFPHSVIIECSCLDLASLMFNEPQLRLCAENFNAVYF